MRTGRPRLLKPLDELQLYLMSRSGVAIRICASYHRVSVPTAKRIIAAQKKLHEERLEPLARELRAIAKSVLESTSTT